MGLRPPPQSRMHWLRLLATCFVINMALTSVWLIVQFDGTFEEGPPSPSELHVTMTIDSENTTGEIKLERATNFIVWVRQREDITSVNGENASSGELAQSISDEHEPQEYLDNVRQAIILISVLIVLCEFFLLVGVAKVNILRNTALFILIFILIFALPLAYVADLNAEGGGASYQSNQPSQSQYAHYTADSEAKLVPLGFIVDFDMAGYDLGWVVPENRENVSQNPPEIGEEGYQSYVKFSGTLQVASSKALQWLLTLPFIWYIIPSQKGKTIGNDLSLNQIMNPGESE